MLYTFRILQVLIAFIPAVLGVLDFVNDMTFFSTNMKNVMYPLTSTPGTVGEGWRDLPASLAPAAYIVMLSAGLICGLLAIAGILAMIVNLNQPAYKFERGKHWIYISCLWGALVWGLGFYAIGTNWFLTYLNSSLSYIGEESLGYVIALFIVFGFLKFCDESSIKKSLARK
jgi:predicted small integral membrane protein